jgi:hypothetical protein
MTTARSNPRYTILPTVLSLHMHLPVMLLPASIWMASPDYVVITLHVQSVFRSRGYFSPRNYSASICIASFDYVNTSLNMLSLFMLPGYVRKKY